MQFKITIRQALRCVKRRMIADDDTFLWLLIMFADKNLFVTKSPFAILIKRVPSKLA